MTEDVSGCGWWLEYVCNLMKYYPQFNREYIEDELPMVQGWAFISWALLHDGWHQFCGLKSVKGKSYIEQQANKLLSQIKNILKTS